MVGHTLTLHHFVYLCRKKKEKRNQRNLYVDRRQWVTWMIGGLQLASDIEKEGGRMVGRRRRSRGVTFSTWPDPIRSWRQLGGATWLYVDFLSLSTWNVLPCYDSDATCLVSSIKVKTIIHMKDPIERALWCHTQLSTLLAYSLNMTDTWQLRFYSWQNYLKAQLLWIYILRKMLKVQFFLLNLYLIFFK